MTPMAQSRVEQRRQLHCNCAGTTAASSAQAAHDNARESSEIDAVVREKAPVLGYDHRSFQRGRYICELGPLKPPSMCFDAHFVEHVPVAIERLCVGRPPMCPQVCI